MTARPQVVLDISALFEETWTGIPNMVSAITARAISDPNIDWTFAYETIPLPTALVERFLRQRSGSGGLDALASLVWDTPPITPDVAQRSVAIFPNIKPVRGYFRKEAIIVSDLSPIIAPQYHNSDNINHFANRIRHDIESSDHLFCISDATRSDVHAYFNKPMDQMSVIRLGAEFDPANLSAGMISLWDKTAEPYVVIVGTLEPRKNGSLIFDYLVQNPGFASQYRIVFIGRDGWLDEKRRLMSRLSESGVAPERVVFTGFISESEKLALMINCAFCVYPSFFEGFGLPVLEAAALGKITVCSNSSSIPEVLPEACVFFNPSELFEFAQAMRIGELRAAQTRSSAQSLSDILERGTPHSWDACYEGIASWVREQAF